MIYNILKTCIGMKRSLLALLPGFSGLGTSVSTEEIAMSELEGWQQWVKAWGLGGFVTGEAGMS